MTDVCCTCSEPFGPFQKTHKLPMRYSNGGVKPILLEKKIADSQRICTRCLTVNQELLKHNGLWGTALNELGELPTFSIEVALSIRQAKSENDKMEEDTSKELLEKTSKEKFTEPKIDPTEISSSSSITTTTTQTEIELQKGQISSQNSVSTVNSCEDSNDTNEKMEIDKNQQKLLDKIQNLLQLPANPKIKQLDNLIAESYTKINEKQQQLEGLGKNLETLTQNQQTINDQLNHHYNQLDSHWRALTASDTNIIQLKPDDVFIQFNENLPYHAGYSPFVNLTAIKKYFGLFSIHVRLKASSGNYLDISDYEAIPPDHYLLEALPNQNLRLTPPDIDRFENKTVYQHLKDIKSQLEDIFDKLLKEGNTNLPG